MYQDGWIGWSRYVDRRTEGKRKRNEWQSVWVFLKLFLWWATSPLWQVKKFHGKCSLYINSFQQMLCNASTWVPNSLFAFGTTKQQKQNLHQILSEQICHCLSAVRFCICQSNLFERVDIKKFKSKNLNLECIKGRKKQLPSQKWDSVGFVKSRKSLHSAHQLFRVVWIKWLLGFDKPQFNHFCKSHQWEKHGFTHPHNCTQL